MDLKWINYMEREQLANGEQAARVPCYLSAVSLFVPEMSLFQRILVRRLASLLNKRLAQLKKVAAWQSGGVILTSPPCRFARFVTLHI